MITDERGEAKPAGLEAWEELPVEEILAALEDDYLDEILYPAPGGSRTVKVTYAKDNRPPDRC